MLLWSSAQMSVASVQVIVDSRDTKWIIGMYDGVGPKFWCIKKSSAVRWQDQKCGYMIPLSIECTSSWWWHDDGRHGDKHDLRIMVLINVFVVFENHKHGIIIVLLKNIQGQDNIENIWVKCLVKCTQANFKAKIQICEEKR